MTGGETAGRVCPQCGQTTPAEMCPIDGARTLPVADPWLAMPGDVVGGRYRIVGKVGEGGFGQVFAAEHTQTGQRFAVKILRDHPRSPAVAIARFAQEAKVCGQLRSPHTVRIADHGATDAGKLYIAMELLVGESLAVRLRRVGRLPAREAVSIAVQVLRSLQEAHAMGLVHRDLKPDNLLLCDVVGTPDFVKVIDFGVAKLSGRDDSPALTRTGVVIGTPHYMSPEQVQAAPVDGRADLYALGVVLFECLCGRVPFARDSDLAACLAHLSDPPPAFADLGGPTDTALEGLVLRALAKRPEDRFRHAQEMATALEVWLATAPMAFNVAVSATEPARHRTTGIDDTTDEAISTSPLRAGPPPLVVRPIVPRAQDPNPRPTWGAPPLRWVVAGAGLVVAAALFAASHWSANAPQAPPQGDAGQRAGLPQGVAAPLPGAPLAEPPTKASVTATAAVAPPIAAPTDPAGAAPLAHLPASLTSAVNSVWRDAAGGTGAKAPVGDKSEAGRAAKPEAARRTLGEAERRARELACAASPGSPAWCLGCPQAKGQAQGSPQDCACRQALGIGIGDATWCACFPTHANCPCGHKRASKLWCTSCPEAQRLEATERDGCACRVHRGELQAGDADWCKCFPRDLSCSPTGCDAVRLGPQWCRNCPKAKQQREFSPDWCQCRKALGEDGRGSDIWCRCFPTDTACPQVDGDRVP